MTDRFSNLPLGTRFRYLPHHRINQVFVVLENWGFGLIAKWNGPTEGPMSHVLAFADSEEDARTWEVEVIE